MDRRLWTPAPLIVSVLGALLTGLLWGRYLEQPTSSFFLIAAVAAFVLGVLITSLGAVARLPPLAAVVAIVAALLIANGFVMLWWLGRSD